MNDRQVVQSLLQALTDIRMSLDDNARVVSVRF